MKKTVVLFAAALALSASCQMFTSPEEASDAAKVTGISFGKSSLSISIGSDEYLPLSIAPSDVQNKVTPKWEYDENLISINADSYGVIITGKQPGSTYIKASLNGYTATCILSVANTSGTYIGEPYIYSGSGIVELQPQASRNISVSLMGGSATDYSGFAWTTSDSMIADIASAMNNCVVRSYKTGTAQITASHPLAKYPYTFIVHSYTDDLSEPYLSTGMNIVTINKTESAVKNITVSLHNSSNAEIMSRYHWEIDSGGEEPVISLSGNGNTAVVAALASGLNRIRVSHDECGWPLYILVRVTTAVTNVFVTTSVSTLEVRGSAYAHTVSADLSGYSGFVDKSKFIWALPDEAALYADCEIYENNLSVTGKLNGAFKAKVSHELSDYARTVLVILREQDGSRIDNSVYITTDKNYVQTKIGAETIPISVALVGGSSGDENSFVWSVDGGENNIFVKFETTHGSVRSRAVMGNLAQGTLYISPRAIGSATVSVSHPKSSYSTDIAVLPEGEDTGTISARFISTAKNAVVLEEPGKSADVSIYGVNIPQTDLYMTTWSDFDRSVVSVAANGASAAITADGFGRARIKVSHPLSAIDLFIDVTVGELYS